MVSPLDERERRVLDDVRRLAGEQLGGEVALEPGDRLVEALELDSLTRATLVVAIEDHFRVRLDDAALERVETAAELCRLIARAEEAP